MGRVEAGLHHAKELENSINPAVNGTFFELGKDKAGKGEAWAPPFTRCAQNTVGL